MTDPSKLTVLEKDARIKELEGVLSEAEKRIKALYHYVQIEVAESMEERRHLLATLEHVFEPINEFRNKK